MTAVDGLVDIGPGLQELLNHDFVSSSSSREKRSGPTVCPHFIHVHTRLEEHFHSSLVTEP